MKYHRSLCLVLLLIAPATGLILAAGCSTNTPKPAATPPTAPALAAVTASGSRFVGNEACAECHAAEFRSHKSSFHSQTARLVQEVGKIVLPKGDLPGSKCRLQPEGDSFSVSVGGALLGAETLQYGFGSGKTGITFVSVLDKVTLFEMRASYFPKIAQWYVTPGQKKLDVEELGFDYPPERGRLCVTCHTTTLPENSIVPERKFLGVGCEACHGAGGDHIAAVKRADTAHLGMDRLNRVGGARVNTLCGRCHRTRQDVMVRSPNNIAETQRFQTLGISQSRCFLESKDQFSCLNCHDAHANASLDMKYYEKACLTCHGPASAPFPITAKRVAAKLCPVNPKTGCIPCHMPARKILPEADRSPVAVDHFIHIPRKGSRPSPYRAL